MIYHFGERKDLNEKVEKELFRMKESYQKQEMPAIELLKLKKKMKEAKRMEQRERNRKRIIRTASAAAAVMAAFVILPNTSASIASAMEQIPVIGYLVDVVTFRDYSYETDRNMADIQVPEIQITDRTDADTDTDTDIDIDIDSDMDTVQDKLSKTTEEINAEIQKISDELIAEFEAGLAYEEGYQDVVVKSEVLATTQDYFTLKLLCYQGAGSGYAWNYYYTIDLNTGERLKLKDIFKEGADYITAISENIKEQMQAQMDADESVYYWLHDEIEEWNFKSITDETSFYINEKGNVVIGFNEGDVAPMYMGTVEFEIPAEVLADLRK